MTLWLLFKISILILSLVAVAVAWAIVVTGKGADYAIREMPEMWQHRFGEAEGCEQATRATLQIVRKVGESW